MKVWVGPLIFTASSETTEAASIVGHQWNWTKANLPFVLTSLNVWIPNPSIIRKERGMVRSDMIHKTMFMLSGNNEMKSQNVSCAVAGEGLGLLENWLGCTLPESRQEAGFRLAP